MDPVTVTLGAISLAGSKVGGQVVRDGHFRPKAVIVRKFGAVLMDKNSLTKSDVNGQREVGSPANQVKTRRAEAARADWREFSLDRGCGRGEVGASPAHIRLF